MQVELAFTSGHHMVDFFFGNAKECLQFMVEKVYPTHRCV